MRKIFVLVISGLFSITHTFSQDQAPLFRHYTPEQGLPSSEVYQVLQDARGYIWFATDHGLVRYNGYEFKTFTTADGLNDNTVFKLLTDHHQRLWMQTFSGQLFYFEEEKIIPYKYNSTVVKLVINSIPTGFYVDTFENVFFASSSKGEYKIDAAGNLSPVFMYSSSVSYNQIFFDEKESNYFITGSNGLNDAAKKTWLCFKNGKQEFDSIYIKQQVNSQVAVVRLNSNRLLISVSEYLFEFKNDSLMPIIKLPSVINSLYEDANKRLWVCTFRGLYLFDDFNTSLRKRHYLEKEFLTGVANDHEGGLWITSVTNGVFYLGNDEIKNYVFDDDNLKEPLCLSAFNHNIYAGFWNGKVAQINTTDCKTVYSSKEGNYISNLFSDHVRNRIYIGQYPAGYLQHEIFFPLKTNSTHTLKGRFIKRSNGDLLNASINGLYRIANDSILVLSALSQRVNCIIENTSGELLLGGNTGVFKYNEQSKTTALFRKEFKDVRVDDIITVNDIVCFATRGKGLMLLHQNQFYSIAEKDGLCSNMIHKLAVYDNSIWCGSYNGISKITFTNIDSMSYRIINISIAEGLPSTEINDIAIYKDTVWVASKKAISFFNAKEDFSNPVEPVVHFTSLRINNKDTVIAERSAFPYHSNTISIGFEALSYKSEGKLTYKYSLVSESDSFVSITTSRQVEFLSLKPGQYIFSVAAMNRSGIWSRKPVSLQFTILTPFWLQWWFQGSIVLLIVLLAYYLVQMRIARIKKQAQLKTDFNKQLVQLEMKALRAQMNPHFIFNVMNSIQDYILKNDSKEAQKYLSKFAKLVRLILDNSVEGEIVLQKEITAALIYVELEQQRFDDKFEFKLDIDSNLDTDHLVIPSMIIQPYLENSIKHGIRHLSHHGKLSLQITQLENSLLIAIEDNGVGRNASAEWNKKNVREHISHGSVITAKRIAAYNIAHNTSIQTTINDVKNEKGEIKGTRVEVQIPLKRKES